MEASSSFLFDVLSYTYSERTPPPKTVIKEGVSAPGGEGGTYYARMYYILVIIFAKRNGNQN